MFDEKCAKGMSNVDETVTNGIDYLFRNKTAKQALKSLWKCPVAVDED